MEQHGGVTNVRRKEHKFDLLAVAQSTTESVVRVMLTTEGLHIVSIFAPEITTWTPEAVLAMRISMSTSGKMTGSTVETADMRISGVPCRVYFPRESDVGTDSSPLVVYIHGGCWVLGDLGSEDATCRQIAEATQSVVLAIGYRLAPEDPFPAALDDIDAVLNNARGISELPGWSGNNFQACGASAGANLLIAAMLRRPAWRERVSSVALICPLVRAEHTSASAFEFGSGYALDLGLLEITTQMYCTDEDRQNPFITIDSSPELLKGLPPTLVLTAGCDPLRDEGEEFALLLSRCGVQTTAIRHIGVPHEFFLVAESNGAGAQGIAQIATHFSTS